MPSPRTETGFTLIELMTTLALLALLMMFAMPNFSAMLQNMKIRSATESILGGLQTARTEALKRNQTVEFVLTSTDPVPDNVTTYAQDPAGSNWAVRSLTSDGYQFIEGRAGAEGSNSASSSVAISANGTGTIAFTGLGTTTLPAAVNINVSNPAGGACKSAAGDEPMRCLRVAVTTTGRVRMCDPSIVALTDTRRC
jgi:type IV fimbrial biogenesis protein FimT